jgi:threonine dehydratase
VAAALYRDPAELGLTPGETAGPVVAVLSGGNIDPTLLADILRD